ncbi:SDR family NAD(P)-dependent oxidoreductase [Streptomyces sp. RGM 3693]|uniref:SDR family NAD(P)-dependent oxidoreductase n=1 Tax=Streptomyces sp. RGM 3693 TaxID=3413284 RepID=UPI003D290051
MSVVTGGTSGIGQAVADLLAEAGHEVVVWGRGGERLAGVARGRPNVTSVEVNVTADDAVGQAVEFVLARFARLDHVINSAGLFHISGTEISPSDAAELFGTNVLAPISVMRHTREALIEHCGAVVNVSSTFARLPAPREAAYAATKAAVESLTRSWASELAEHGVRVNAVAPGPTDTPILGNAGLDEAAAVALRMSSSSRMPLGRLGRPQEVAWWAAALLRPEAQWMTGQTITIDGGWGVL